MPTNETQAEISWEEAVSRFLTDNPDFFITHPDILATITVPHTESGQATSLIEKQVAVLREQNLQLDRQLREMIAHARENEVISRRLHNLAVAVLMATDETSLLAIATDNVKEAFHLDGVAIRLVDNGAGVSRSVEELGADDDLLAPLMLLVSGGKPVCGSFLDDGQRDYLFSNATADIKSCALMLLKADGVNGVYCLGSQDPHRFDKEMATDYLGKLADLVAAALAQRAKN